MRPGGRTRSRGSRGGGVGGVGGETKAETVPNRAGPPIPRHPPPRLFSAAQLLSRPPSLSARAHPPALSPAAPPRPLRAAHPAQVPAATAATPLPPQPPPPPSPPRLPPPPPRLTLSRRRRKAPRLLPRVKFPGPGFTTLPCLPAAGPRERGVEGGDLWRGGAKVSPEARWRLRASGWGCRAGKLQRAWESPALNPPSSALRAARPADLAEPGKDGPDWRSHEAAAKLTRSGPAPRPLDQSSKNAFPQLYYV